MAAGTTRRVALGLAALMIGGCSSSSTSEPICSAAKLEAALDGASPGETVRIGRCTITGSFVVPPGVTLSGAGVGESTIAGDGAAPALTVETGGQVTTVSDLSLAAASGGIAASGSGEAVISAVTIEVATGIGIVAGGLARLTVRDAVVHGPWTAERAATLVDAPTPEGTATDGLVADCVSDVVVERTSVSGFARFGALLVASRARWTGGGTTGNVGVGMVLWGGLVELDDVEIAHIFGSAGLLPPYGLVVASGAELTARAVRIEDAGFAVLQDQSVASFTDVVVRDNDRAGVWTQNQSTTAIERGDFADNTFAGIIALGAEALAVRETTIDRTRTIMRVTGETGVTVMGDGLLVVRARTEGLVLEDLSMSNNGRIGALVDLGAGALVGATIERVTVSAEGESMGFVVQNGTVDPGWDATVTRLGATAANDATALIGPDGMPRDLDVVTVADVTPRPRPDPFASCL